MTFSKEKKALKSISLISSFFFHIPSVLEEEMDDLNFRAVFTLLALAVLFC